MFGLYLHGSRRLGAILGIALFAPNAARCAEEAERICSTPFSMPFEVTIDVTAPPVTGGDIAFELSLVPDEDIDQVALTFETEGVVSLSASLDQTLASLPAGVPVVIPGTLTNSGPGAGSLFVMARVIDATSCGDVPHEGEAYALHVLDDGVTVLTGDGSVIELELARIQALLDAGALTTEDAEQAADALLAATGVPEDEDGSTLAASGTGDITIEGVAQWTDSAGGLHPSRHVVVKAYKPGVLFGINEVATTSAGADGKFSFTLDPALLGDEPRDITIRVFSENPAANVRTPTSFLFWGGNTYYRERVFKDVLDGTALVGEMFTANNTGEPDRAFSIADAMLVSRDYVQAVHSTPMATIPVNWPGKGSQAFFSPSSTVITIGALMAFAWDVMHHEYGHYISHTFGLDNETGDNHNCGDDLIMRYGKDKGARLAWGEGLATYLGIAAQAVTNAAALGVPTVGNTAYDSVTKTGSSWSFDLEIHDNCKCSGEGCETNICRALWDAADSAIDGDDNIAIGHAAVWNAIVAATPHNTVTDAWLSLTASADNSTLAKYGKLFAQNKIAPSLSTPIDGDALSSTPPTFTWIRHGLNEFTVKFYDDMFVEIGTSPMLGDVAQWTPTTSEWQTILAAATTDITWVVEGEGTEAPKSGVYWSDCRKLGGVDFGFVIDDTGSMSEEIDSVKSALSSFLSSFDPASTDVTFQLTTFKDGVTVFPPTNDVSVIQSQVSGLSASGGGDCPENSASALLQGTAAMHSGATVILASDADPHLGSDLEGIKSALNSRGVHVNTLLSGTCFGTYLTSGLSPYAGQSNEGGDYLASAGEGSYDGAVDFYSQISTITGGAFAFIPEVNFGGSGVIKYKNAAQNIIQSAVEPRIVQVLPSALPQGALATLTLKGQNTNFLSSTEVSFGAEVEVQKVTAIDALTLAVEVAVPTDAVTGFVDGVAETVLSAGVTELALGLGALEVVPAAATPTLVSADPPTATVGEMLDVTITAVDTAFDTTSVVDFGPGIVVDGIAVVSSTQLMVAISVDETASIGFRNVSVTTGAEVASAAVTEFFRVEVSAPGIPFITAVTPAEAAPGTKVDVTLETSGVDLTGEVSVAFSGGGVVATDAIACGDLVSVAVEVSPGAAPGFRDVILTAGGTSITRLNAFLVTGGGPPAVGLFNPGDKLVGKFTTFEQESAIDFLAIKGMVLRLTFPTTKKVTRVSVRLIDPDGEIEQSFVFKYNPNHATHKNKTLKKSGRYTLVTEPIDGDLGKYVVLTDRELPKAAAKSKKKVSGASDTFQVLALPGATLSMILPPDSDGTPLAATVVAPDGQQLDVSVFATVTSSGKLKVSDLPLPQLGVYEVIVGGLAKNEKATATVKPSQPKKGKAKVALD